MKTILVFCLILTACGKKGGDVSSAAAGDPNAYYIGAWKTVTIDPCMNRFIGANAVLNIDADKKIYWTENGQTSTSSYTDFTFDGVHLYLRNLFAWEWERITDTKVIVHFETNCNGDYRKQ